MVLGHFFAEFFIKDFFWKMYSDFYVKVKVIFFQSNKFWNQPYLNLQVGCLLVYLRDVGIDLHLPAPKSQHLDVVWDSNLQQQCSLTNDDDWWHHQYVIRFVSVLQMLKEIWCTMSKLFQNPTKYSGILKHISWRCGMLLCCCVTG